MKPKIQLSIGSVQITDPKNELLNEIVRQIENTTPVIDGVIVQQDFEFIIDTSEPCFIVEVAGNVTFWGHDEKETNSFVEKSKSCTITILTGYLDFFECQIIYNGNPNFHKLIEETIEKR